MKKILSLFFCFFSCFLGAQSLQFDWVKQLGGSSDDAGVCVKVDASGNVYTVGQYYGVTDFDPGPGTYTLAVSMGYKSVYLCKLDLTGSFIWAKEVIQLSNSPDVFDLELDSYGNIFIIGSFFNTGDFDPGPGVLTKNSNGLRDIYISKLDWQGNLIWASNVGGPNHDKGSGLVLDEFNNLYVTGHFIDTADFDPGPGVFNLSATGPIGDCDVFVLKLDSLGHLVWAKNVGGVDYDFSYSIELDRAGNVYTSGAFYGLVDFDPGIGIYNLPASNNSDLFFLKLDPLGNFVWAKNIDGSSYVEGYSLSTDNSNNLYATGTFDSIVDFDPGAGTLNLMSNGNTDAFVLKLNSTGDLVWIEQIGGTLRDAAGSIINDTIGNCYIMGVFGGTVDFDPSAGVNDLTSLGNGDAFILKLDSIGNFVWVNSFGGSTDDVPNSITLDSAGCLYTTGWFNGTSDFDPGIGTANVTSFGLADAYVHKMCISTVGIKENKNENIVIYPNPNSGLFCITIRETSEIVIENVLGQSEEKHILKPGKHNLNIENQSSGIYFVKVNQDGKQHIIKLIKE